MRLLVFILLCLWGIGDCLAQSTTSETTSINYDNEDYNDLDGVRESNPNTKEEKRKTLTFLKGMY